MDDEPGTWRGPVGPVRTAVLLLVLGIVLFLTYETFRFCLLTSVMAAPVAVLLGPVQSRLTARMGHRRSFAAGLLVVLTASLVVVPLTGGLALVGSQAMNFFSWLGPRLGPGSVQHFFDVTLPAKAPRLGAAWDTWKPYLVPTTSSLLAQVAGGANFLIQRLASGVGTMVFEFLLFLLFLFFMLRDGRSLIGLLRSLSPLSTGQEARVVDHLVATTRGTLLGVLVVPLVQGGLATLGYWMFGVPNALLWGAITVFGCLIPLLGAPVVWIPMCVYVYLNGALWHAIALLIYGVVVISGIDNVIKPVLLAGAARVHPLFGFLAVVGGTLTFGPVGILMGPIVLSLAISALDIYRTEFLEQSDPALHPSPQSTRI
ncbi:MAG: AI-2E family transporter [Bacteroidota bacterium]